LLDRVVVSAIGLAALGHPVQIISGAKGASRSRNDYDVDFGIAIAIIERMQNFDADSKVERVQTFRPVQRDPADVGLAAHEQMTKFHNPSPLWLGAPNAVEATLAHQTRGAHTIRIDPASGDYFAARALRV
jgi:hypothetical protein